MGDIPTVPVSFTALLGWKRSKCLKQTQSSLSTLASVSCQSRWVESVRLAYSSSEWHCWYCGNTGGIWVPLRHTWSFIPRAREACYHMPTLDFHMHLFVCRSLHCANTNPTHVCDLHSFIFITLSPTEHPGKKKIVMSTKLTCFHEQHS